MSIAAGEHLSSAALGVELYLPLRRFWDWTELYLSLDIALVPPWPPLVHPHNRPRTVRCLTRVKRRFRLSQPARFVRGGDKREAPRVPSPTPDFIGQSNARQARSAAAVTRQPHEKLSRPRHAQPLARLRQLSLWLVSRHGGWPGSAWSEPRLRPSKRHDRRGDAHVWACWRVGVPASHPTEAWPATRGCGYSPQFFVGAGCGASAGNALNTESEVHRPALSCRRSTRRWPGHSGGSAGSTTAGCWSTISEHRRCSRARRWRCCANCARAAACATGCCR